MKYQCTFYNTEKKYKPITVTLTPRPHEKMESLRRRAILKACAERGWGFDEMIYKYKYQKYRYRLLTDEGKPLMNTEKKEE